MTEGKRDLTAITIQEEKEEDVEEQSDVASLEEQVACPRFPTGGKFPLVLVVLVLFVSLTEICVDRGWRLVYRLSPFELCLLESLEKPIGKQTKFRLPLVILNGSLC